jgi:hypothetical protein
MAEFLKSNTGNENWAEKGSRWLRNVNALGAVAFGGAGVLVGSEVLVAYGVFNAATAVFFEITRRITQKKFPKHSLT